MTTTAKDEAPVRAAGRRPATAHDRGLLDFRDQAGCLIRRLHQIATAIFLDRVGAAGVTPVQYAALSAIGGHPGFDQRQLARLIAVDRTTMNMVTRRLAERGWIARERAGKQLILRLTPDGQGALEALSDQVMDHADELLAPLDTAEREHFLALLRRLVNENNDLSRVPVAQRHD